MEERKKCISCGDCVTDKEWEKAHGRCYECFDELNEGIIPDVIGPTHQSLASHLTPRQRAKLKG
jgi:hypothetical protein